MDNKITLYINTIKHLKSSQIYYRLSNRLKREMYKKNLLAVKVPKELKTQDSYDYLLPELDFSKEYLERFDAEDILNNRFTFINITNEVELSRVWNNQELQHLWRYNLHYFEYLYKLANEYSKEDNLNQYYKKYKTLIDSWIKNNQFAYGDGWHPYTISLRITNWISTYQIFKERVLNDKDFDKRLKDSLYLQYKYLENNLEKDVLGNHYFENIKALIIGSIFFEDKRVKEKFKKELLEQLDEQILEDGMHFELSPMYHKIILEDLIKITFWLKGEPIYNKLIHVIQKMVDATFSIEEGVGKTPAFNDSTDGISKNYISLFEACKIHFDIIPQKKFTFEKSGFYIIEDNNKKLVFNTSDVCPTYLPAHAHCDALSFELSIDGLPLIVNAGTYRYENGEWRDYFRSTKAHNTVFISDQEQSQFWGSFRVAKRIKKVRRKQFVYKGIHFYIGEYVAYQGAKHKRYIGHLDENTIIVLDYVKAESISKINSLLHFIPNTKLNIDNKTVHVVNDEKSIDITAIGTSGIEIEKGWYSKQFNLKEENEHLVLRKNEDSKFYGYLIGISSDKKEVIQLKDDLKIIINGKEKIINFDELGELL
ncbi:putative heparinase superfamily protein [Sinobaca qinghaiensis]|uniref:Putative heparinase superfamily protein n=1 Tax=Sinobaca qinghaiensis TaxID=342944 RepID=A0A419V886_9BACL|nr:heparinase II/III family protein [Sinobaca qinghaiensis]RKD76301.1 putative heparinase superfamily protein [Sinobaca qinghaiensis]